MMQRDTWHGLRHLFRSLTIACLGGVAAFYLFMACGTDDEDVTEIDGEVGSVPGAFTMRIGDSYRAKIDQIEAQVNSIVPGLTAQFTQSFAGNEEETGTDGNKLSDLFKLKVPGTKVDVVNREIFNKLVDLKDEEETNYFEVVDTRKYTNSDYAVGEADKSDSTRFGDQYYLNAIGWETAVAGVDTLLATSVPVVVAVLDTGMYTAHEEFEGVLWNYNGVIGYDAVAGAEITADAGSSDSDGHGTHVAGIIGGNGTNGKGIDGVGFLPGRGGDSAKSITELMNVKVLNDNGSGTSEQINGGLKWAVETFWARKAAEPAYQNAKMVINMSLGGPFETDGYTYPTDETSGEPVLTDDIFSYATKNGDVLIIVAAGNETCGIGGSCDVYGRTFTKTFYYPCSYKGVLCVAASTDEEKLAGFSNRLASVGVVAPGYQIISAGNAQGEYATYSGTSQATPVTAGASALLWSLYPALSNVDITPLLQRSSDTSNAAITGEINATYGRIDLPRAFELAAAATAANAEDPDPANVEWEGTAAVTNTKAAPAGGVDRVAASPNQQGSQRKDKGKGSGGGCGVIFAFPGQSAPWLTLLMLITPILGLLPRMRRS